MNELLIELDADAKIPLYGQIYEYIRRGIMDGRLSCGERLPSARLLAANLKISRSTADAAYQQLVSEGYLQAKRGSGYYVSDVTGLYDFAGNMFRRPGDLAGSRNNRGSKDSTEIGGSKDSTEIRGSKDSTEIRGNKERKTDIGNRSDREGTSRADTGSPYGKEDGRSGDETQTGLKPLYNFLPGQIDDSGFAYNAWRKCAKEALLELETRHCLLPAGHPQGEYALRKAITAYLYQARGVRCEPEQMIIGAGNEYLLQLLGQILGGPQTVAMESPTYLPAYHTFCNIGNQVLAVPMDLEGMRVEEIPDGTTLAYVMPSHQFPLGAVMPLRRRLQLLAWAQGSAQRYIIEDDHDSEFRYKGRPIPALQGMAKQERVIYLGTFSNSIMPSIRISYLVLPQSLMEAYKTTCGFYASTVSRLQQMTVCRFLEQGYFERHLNKMRGIYKAKHDMLLQLLKDKTWVHRIYGDHAGLHLAAELDCGMTEDEVIRQARSFGMALQGMSRCYLAGGKKPDARPVLLLGFGSLTQEQLREGVGILERCVKMR